MSERSYLSKSFTIADPDARLRREDDLMTFQVSGGVIEKIPQSTVVRVDAVQRIQTGASKVALFAHTVNAEGVPLGWTSIANIRGKFVNETLELLAPQAGAGKFGPNAAWSAGAYIGQIDLVEIVDAKSEIKRISAVTVQPYFQLVSAAQKVDVTIALNSGFRSYSEQKFLWDGFQRGLPGFNKAARPGTSNHQNGIAFDIAVSGADGSDVYDWLKVHAPSFGFVRTVSGEPWHWEYDAALARDALDRNSFKTPTVVA
jgi:hypothetical protein